MGNGIWHSRFLFNAMSSAALYLAPLAIIQLRESLTMTYYIRRNGGMVFWRIGRLGGSFYLSHSAREHANAKAIRRAKRVNAKRELTFYRRNAYLGV
jgi:hypothetical protein